MEECDQKQQEGTRQNLRSVFPPPQIHPWLMFIHGKNKRNQTFYSLSENCVHIKSIPNMRGKIYFGSYFGWMVLLDECSDDCFLLNPVSMKKIQLPPWGNFTSRCCLLTSPPDDTSCILLFAEEVESGRASFRFCKPGDRYWSYQDIHIGIDEYVYDAIICKGQIYALVEAPPMRKLVILHIGKGDRIVMETEAIPLIPYPNTVRMATSIIDRLVESSGEVFLVTLARRGSRPPANEHVHDVAIQKMDICRKECVEVKSIGDRAFFIGRSCWTSCPAKESGIQGNTIYFTMDKVRSLYAFDLEEKNLTITLPCPNVIDNWSQPDWILPNF